MALTLQNLRATGPGTEPSTLLPGQIAFNVLDKVMFVGNGTDVKTRFDGTSSVGVPGEGWYSMPMDFSQFSTNFIVNPEVYGDLPTDGQVLTWDDTLNHTIWSNGGNASNIVYNTTNSAVALAPGVTLTIKINNAIGVVSPDNNDWVVISGLPGDIYQGLYFFDAGWIRAAQYAFPTAAQVPYSNNASGLTANDVQEGIDELDTLVTTAQASANSAFAAAGIAQDAADTAQTTADDAILDAATAQATADAALPRAGGTMTGALIAQEVTTTTLNTNQINVASGFGITFATGALGTIFGISGVVNSTSITTAASSAGLKTAYDLANSALQRAGGTMTGAITFVAGQLFPISGIDIATVGQLGVIQVGNHLNINVAGVLNVDVATTLTQGVVQLNNTLSSTLTTQALTAAQGNVLQGQIDSLTLASNVTLAGSLNAATGLIDSVTTLGASVGFVAGSVLPAPSVANTDYYVLTTVGGSYSPPGGGGPYAAENGDWFLSNGTVYQYLGVGARPQSASYIASGIVQLADTAVTYTGTSDTEAITPNSLQDKLSDSTSLADSNRIASSTAVKSAYDLANAALPKTGGIMTGNVTFADAGEGVIFSNASSIISISDDVGNTNSDVAASSTAVRIANSLAAAAIPCSVVVGKGAIVTGSAVGVPTALPVGTTGQVLIANAATATGLEWVNDTPGDVTSVTATSPVTANNTDPQNPIIGIDAASTTQAGAVQLNDTVISTSTTEAATANAVKSAYDIGAAAVPCSSFVAKGDLLGGTASGTYSAISVGTNGQVLIANSTCSAGITWGDACYVPNSCFTTAGQLIVGTGAGTYVALPVGTTGQSLIVDLTCTATGGLKWGQSLIGYTCSASPFNTAFGAFAGDSITSGTNNVALGVNALAAVTTTSLNVAVGSGSMAAATGTQNVSVGANALCNTAGSNSVAIGFTAGRAATAGSNNTFVGSTSGSNITGGGSNTAIGFSALNASSSGAGNTVAGFQAMAFGTGSTCNVAIGFEAGRLLGGGSNTLVGCCAGSSITTGSCNVILGGYTGTTTLARNVVLSDGAGAIRFQSNANGAWSYDGTNFGTIGQFLASNGTVAAPVWCTLTLACVPCAAFVACGDLLVGTGSATFTALPTGTNGQALVVDTTCTATGGLKWVTPNNLCGYTCTATPFNTALGTNAGVNTSSGSNNVSLGYDAGINVTTGAQSVFIGRQAGRVSNGIGSVAIGFCASVANANEGCTTYIGFVSGRLATGASNTYVGALTGCAASNTSACGTFLGFCSGSAVTTGNGNTFLGHQSGRLVTTGGFNVAIGVATFQSATTGVCNVAVGCGALNGNITGNGSTAIGTRALTNTSGAGVNTAVGSEAGAQTTGTGNAYFGVNAGCAVNTGTCNTLIGRNSGTAITTGSCNTIVGSFAGSTTLANNVVLADGAGVIKLQVNGNGAIGVGPTPSFGTAGQVLGSTGVGNASAWTSSLPEVTAPTASTDAGVQGQIASDATYFYMYTGGRWQRIAWDVTVW